MAPVCALNKNVAIAPSNSSVNFRSQKIRKCFNLSFS